MENVTITALDILRDIAGEQETADEKNVLLGLANTFEQEIKRLEAMRNDLELAHRVLREIQDDAGHYLPPEDGIVATPLENFAHSIAVKVLAALPPNVKVSGTP